MPEPKLINPVEQKNWNDMLLATPGYSFFHTSNWADVLNKSYKYNPIYLLSGDFDSFEGLFPIMEVNSSLTGRNGVCLPFSDMCSPLARNEQQLQNLFNTAIDLGKKKKWKCLEIRGGERFLSAQKPSQTFLTHTLNLSRGPQQLLSDFRNSTRRNIKKAINEGVEVNISSSIEDLKEFCRLNALTRKKHGLPPQPFSFFKNLHESIIAPGMGFIAIASSNKKAIAANIYFNFGEEVIFKYGASDKTWHHLRANNLVMWEAIKWSCEKGFKRLSFGRTEPENHGLVQYKAGWGAKPYQINYYRYDLRENCFTTNYSAINPLFMTFFSKLPIPILEILGRVLYRHMG